MTPIQVSPLLPQSQEMGVWRCFLLDVLSFREMTPQVFEKVISWVVKLVRSCMKIYIHFKEQRIYNH